MFKGGGIKKRKRAALSALGALQETLGELSDIAVGSHMTSSSAADAIHQEQMARVDGLLGEAKTQYQELASLEPFWQARKLSGRTGDLIPGGESGLES